MIKRYLLVLGTTSVILQIASGMGVNQSQLRNISPGSAIAQFPPYPPPHVTTETAIAQFPPCPPPPPPMMGMESESQTEPPWAKNINLSNEQRSRIQAVHEQGIKGIQKIQQQLFEADGKMRSLLESSTPLEQLRQQQQYIQTLRQQIDNNHFEMMLAERQVLTQEQLIQLKELMQQQWGPP